MEEAGLANNARATRRRLAIDDVSQFLTDQQWQRLKPREVSCVDSRAVAGWSKILQDGVRMVILDENWPFSAPRVYLGKNHSLIGGAHVEGNGRLCIAPPHSSYSQKCPIELLKAVLKESDILIATISNRSDFIDEFQSYWLRDMKPKRKCLSLLQQRESSRMVWSWHGKLFSVFSDSDTELRDWMRHIGRLDQSLVIDQSAFIWIEDGLVPSEFPKTGRQLRELIEQRVPEALPLLTECAAHPACRVLIGFGTNHGPTMAGVIVRRPLDFINGFRPKAMPQSIAVSRFFGRDKLEACRVERIDHEWIHSRGGENHHTKLKDKKVIIVGCGSLGSGIAVLLAKSGVGHITLIDDDNLQLENIARHSLGFMSDNQNKSIALARELNRQMPTINVKSIDLTWQQAVDRGKISFDRADLIISTTGDWLADSMLNFECRTSLRTPPVLFGWLEEYALAGHALFVSDIGGCLACGMDEFGRFKDRLTAWPNGSTMLRIPACGGHYQPYGATNLSVIQSLVAATALDALTDVLRRSELRSWLAAKALVHQKGGSNLGDSLPELGGYRSYPWQKSAMCELCR